MEITRVPYYESPLVKLFHGDAIEVLRDLPDNSIHMCVTSPPYFRLRSYLKDDDPNKGQELGSESLHDCAGWATGAACGECYICHMVAVFDEVRRVLRDDGTLWLNIGDSYNGSGGAGGDYGPNGLRAGQPRYAGRTLRSLGNRGTAILKPKDMCLIPARLALALQAAGWYVRSQIVWAKKAPMPESATDRPTKAWETIWLLSKSARYYYDAEAVREPVSSSFANDPRTGTERVRDTAAAEAKFGKNTSASRRNAGGHFGDTLGRNLRDVWLLGPEPYPVAHFATFVTEVPRRCIKAGTSQAGCCPACGAPWRRMTVTTVWAPSCACDAGDPVPCAVLEPFAGSGTTLAVAKELVRRSIGIELNADYLRLAVERIRGTESGFNLAMEVGG